MNPRVVALEALARIDEGAYANLVLPGLLERHRLSPRDRNLVTELVYGTTRMRRACDHRIDAFLRHEAEPEVRRLLRLGAYQLAYTRVPPHAAVSGMVALAPLRARGLVNAVLRRLARAQDPPWPSTAVELSYPDWVVERLEIDLGPTTARQALECMNRPPSVTRRPDGYVQDRASQWVAAYVSAGQPATVADVCAGPGGKATFLAGAGPRVVALDLHPGRAGLIRQNARALGLDRRVAVASADAERAPLRPASFEAVLVDAPCSGLGVLRRRPDARWRLDAEAVDRLGDLQKRLLRASADLVGVGGRLIYSVCTLTAAETLDVDRWVEAELGDFSPEPGPQGPWRKHGRGSLLLPQAADTDGMYVLGLRRRSR